MVTLGKATKPPRGEIALNRQEQDFAFRLATSNKKFDKASDANKRVLIAKDVLKWLSIGKIQAEPGTYIGLPYADASRDGYKKVSSDERVNGDECRACALGAVFACAVERAGGIRDFWEQPSVVMRQKLGAYFTLWQLQLIETAFEASHGFAVIPYGLSEEEEDAHYVARDKAVEFGRAIRDPQERMRAIMENIVANKGTFVP